MTVQEARSLVEAIIQAYKLPDGDVAMIVEDATIERPWGWVFHYQSRRFLETGDVSAALAGNAPLFVDARTGVVTRGGTAYPVEHYIEEYERKRGAEKSSPSM